MKKFLVILGGVLFATSLMVGTAMAERLTGDLTVTASIVNECNISDADLEFGVYGIFEPGDNTKSKQIEIHCTNGTSITVSASNGLHYESNTRRMKVADEDSFLEYNLLTTQGGENEWNTVNTIPYSQINGDAGTITVYGKIPAGQTAAVVGAYSDTVTLTVAYDADSGDGGDGG